jgi:predicted ATPase
MKPGHRSNQRPILQIKLENLLSFGPGSGPLKLENLNVLIGPNAAGKSNLIEALSLMRSTAMPQTSPSSNADLRGVVRRGGGVNEWIWKGGGAGSASLDVVVHNPKGKQPLRHVLSFRGDGLGFILEDERIENEAPDVGHNEPYFYYQFQNGHPVVNTLSAPGRKLARESLDMELSILAQRRDPEQYPEIGYLAGVYERIRIYREWAFGRNTIFREPQRADMRNDRLEEDFSNLGLFLSRLRKTPKAKAAILDGLGAVKQ